MNKLSLNFFGEKVDIQLPETLESLRKNISEKFLLSATDTAELIITYAKNFGQKFIETENDFKEFIKSKVFKVNLEVDQNSQIYKNSLIKLQTENEENKNLLEILIKRREDLKILKKEKQENAQKIMGVFLKKKKELENKKREYIKKINYEINNNKKEINKIKKNLEEDNKKIKKEEKQINKNIEEIKIKLGIVIEEPKKKSKKLRKGLRAGRESRKIVSNEIKNNLSKKDKEKKRHCNIKIEEKENNLNVKCDGCEIKIIKGIRYNCKRCFDFNYCEKCYKEKKKEYGHSFVSIKKYENKKKINIENL